MNDDSWIKTYENTEKIIEKSIKENKGFTKAAFFSLGLAGIGAALLASSRFEPILAGGASALVTGMVMGGYFWMSKSKNIETIEIKERMLEKLYKLMPPEDQDFIDNKKQKALEAIEVLRENNKSTENAVSKNQSFKKRII